MEIIVFAVWIGIPILIGNAAKKKNRDWVSWAVPAILPMLWIPLGIAVVIASPLCPKCRDPIATEEQKRSVCPRCGKFDPLAPRSR